MKKIHIIGPQGQKNINDLVIYLILPCNILHAFTQSAADGNFIKYLEILLISIGIQVFCVIYGKVMFRKEPEGRYKCLQYGTICSNAGFLGNPIAEGIYGAEGLVHPNDEGGMAWNDPEIGIEWPELKGEYQGSASAEGYTLADGTALILSDKDQKWMGLKDTFKF